MFNPSIALSHSRFDVKTCRTVKPNSIQSVGQISEFKSLRDRFKSVEVLFFSRWAQKEMLFPCRKYVAKVTEERVRVWVCVYVCSRERGRLRYPVNTRTAAADVKLNAPPCMSASAQQNFNPCTTLVTHLKPVFERCKCQDRFISVSVCSTEQYGL